MRRDINNDRFQENEESHMSDSSLGSAVTGSYLDSFSAKVNNEGQESSTCTSVVSILPLLFLFVLFH